MEAEPNIMPEMKILPAGFQAVGAFVGGLCECVIRTSPLPQRSQRELSTHLGGASAMLDKALEDSEL